jgi:ABC-type nitrate/sulfonate/bicarbonate transport system permease component
MTLGTVEPAALPRPDAEAKASRPRDDRLFLLLARVGLLIVLIAFWQLNSGGRGSLLPDYAFGTPSAVGSQFLHLLSGGQLYSSLWSTLITVLYATAVSAPVGIVLAIATSVPVGRWLLEPLVTITYAVPKVGLISIYILLLGVSGATHIALVGGATMFLYYYAMRQAISEIDRRQLIDFRLLGAGWLKVARSLLLPAASPNLIGATRLALPLGFAVEIFAELRIPTSSGLGALLEADSSAQNTAGSVAVMLFVLLIGYLLDLLLGGVLGRYARSTGTGVVV